MSSGVLGWSVFGVVFGSDVLGSWSSVCVDGHGWVCFALVALVSWAKVQNARARLMQMVGMAIWGRSAAVVAMVIPKTARLV